MISNRTIKAFRQNDIEKIERIKTKDLVNLVIYLSIKQGFTLPDKAPQKPSGNIYLQKQNERYLVTCLTHSDKQADTELIDSLLMTIQQEELNGAFLITTTHFADEVKKRARGTQVMLKDRTNLQESVGEFPAEKSRSGKFLIPLILIAIILLGFVFVLPAFREQHVLTPLSNHDFNKPDFSGKHTNGLYTYSYLDRDGVYKTISSPELLEFNIVNNKGVYSGTTEEGKRLAQFLNVRQ